MVSPHILKSSWRCWVTIQLRSCRRMIKIWDPAVTGTRRRGWSYRCQVACWFPFCTSEALMQKWCLEGLTAVEPFYLKQSFWMMGFFGLHKTTPLISEAQIFVVGVSLPIQNCKNPGQCTNQKPEPMYGKLQKMSGPFRNPKTSSTDEHCSRHRMFKPHVFKCVILSSHQISIKRRKTQGGAPQS